MMIERESRRHVLHRAGVLAALVTAGGLGCSTASEPADGVPAGLSSIVVDGVGLDRPTAILHDPVDDVYLVGNVARNGSAFIARVSPGGRVRKLRWIDGAGAGVQLSSPGGMAIRGDTLHVADRDCIRLFVRSTGAPAGSICPPGAVALNDAAVDARGRVYFSDAAGVVYVMDGASGIAELARDPALVRAAGLSAGERGVFVASAGLYQLTPDGLRVVMRDQGRRLGGIVFTRDGSFAFSNPGDSTVLFVEAIENGTRGAVWTLVRSLSSPGDLGYDARRERILIPEADRHRLVFVDLEP